MSLILVIVVVVFIIFTLIILTILLHYYNLAVQCDLSPNIMCYTDWKCPKDSLGNVTNDANGTPIPGDDLHCHLKGLYGVLTDEETKLGAPCYGYAGKNQNQRNCIPYLFEINEDGTVKKDKEGNPVPVEEEDFYNNLKGCNTNGTVEKEEVANPFNCSCFDNLKGNRTYDDPTNKITYDMASVACKDFYNFMASPDFVINGETYPKGSCTKF
jgi:hypothetical protein